MGISKCSPSKRKPLNVEIEALVEKIRSLVTAVKRHEQDLSSQELSSSPQFGQDKLLLGELALNGLICKLIELAKCSDVDPGYLMLPLKVENSLKELIGEVPGAGEMLHSIVDDARNLALSAV